MKAPALKADPEKYPGLAKNPALERALRIRQAVEAGKPRDEAVRLAEQAMGRRAPVMSTARPKEVGRPAAGPRPGGAKETPRKRPPVPGGVRVAKPRRRQD